MCNMTEKVHQDSGQRFVCIVDDCTRSYSTAGNLTAHLKSHTGQYHYMCMYCSKAFLTSYALKLHYRSHTQERPYHCNFPDCYKSFNTVYRLNAHKRIHSGNTFKCTFSGCSREYTTQTELRKHSRCHTGERPYVCPVEECGMKFSMSHHCKAHQQSRHGCVRKPIVQPSVSSSRVDAADIQNIESNIERSPVMNYVDCVTGAAILSGIRPLSDLPSQSVSRHSHTVAGTDADSDQQSQVAEETVLTDTNDELDSYEMYASPQPNICLNDIWLSSATVDLGSPLMPRGSSSYTVVHEHAS